MHRPPRTLGANAARLGVERPPNPTHPRASGGGLHHAAIAALVLASVSVLPLVIPPLDVEAYYLAFGLLVLVSLPLVIGLARGTLDLFEPIIPISLLIGLAFGIRAMYFAYDPVTLSLVTLSRVSFDDFTSRALQVTILGYCALLIGYYVISGPLSRALQGARRYVSRTTWSPSKLRGANIVGLMALGVAGTAARVATGELGATAGDVNSASFAIGLLSSFVQLSACILTLYIAAGDTRRWLRLTLWLGVLPLAAFQTFAFVGKSSLLLTFYVTAAAWHYARRPIRLPLIAAGVVLSVLLVFPALNAFRGTDDRTLDVAFAGASAEDFSSRVSEIPSLFTGMTVPEYLQLSLESVIGRANGIDSLALIMKYSSALPPSAYWQIPLYAFVPRVIWPDKPVIVTGAEFARLFVVPLEVGERDYPSIGVFHLGDLYATYGFAGVLIGMCVLGCLYRLVYAILDPAHSPDLGRKFLYIFLLWSMVTGFESDIPVVYGNLLKYLLIWYLIKLWFNARARGDVAARNPAAIRASVVAPQRPRAAFNLTAPPR